MFKNQFIVVLLFVALAFTWTVIPGCTRDDEVVELDSSAPQANEQIESTEEDQKIYVYVTGAVNKPGMVELDKGKDDLRAADAINASGGLLPTADVDKFNMAEIIKDGQHIRVPERKIAQVSDSQSNSGSGGASSDGVININTANAEELDRLPGIGPAMAQRIIEYRETNGGFKTIEDLQNVKGIGAKKFENLKNKVTL